MDLLLRDRAGFTLMEIMVSLAIIGIALVTILQLFSGALRSARLSKDYSIALLEAKKKMDMIVAVRSIDDLDVLFEEEEFTQIREGYSYDILGPDEFDLPEGLYTDVEDENGSPDDLDDQLYTVGIRINWGDGKEITLNTIRMLEKED